MEIHQESHFLKIPRIIYSFIPNELEKPFVDSASILAVIQLFERALEKPPMMLKAVLKQSRRKDGLTY